MNVETVLLFNPRSNNHQARIPNSVLQIAASIDGKYDWVIVDGNREDDPWIKIENYLTTYRISVFGCTVMPGPQLQQAITYTKRINKQFPHVKIVWGGYFAANQHKVVLNSNWVDVVINGPGDKAFPLWLDSLENGNVTKEIPNLIYKENGYIVSTQKDSLYDQDSLPDLPYEKLDKFYSLSGYLGKSWLGKKTIAYHSSFGCPFTCSFCAVVPIYNAKWRGQSADKIYNHIKFLKEKYDADAIEFHDNNFFVHEKRVKEFSEKMIGENITWWGEGRIDTMDRYSNETLHLMRKAGCKMIFFGAETGNDEILKKMDKGGKQSAQQILSFAARMKEVDIIPEYSFVLGTPAETEEKVWEQLRGDMEFILKVKEANPSTEIIIYIYSPVPVEGSDMYNKVLESGFRFPQHLEDWLNPDWLQFDLRKNPLTPWLKPEMIDSIKYFETVLNGYYPTVSDIRLNAWKRSIIKVLSFWRFKSGIYKFPYEIKALQKIWKYRQPETEGF